MFRIIKAGAGIGLTENLNYIKKAENGCYILCPEQDASGIVLRVWLTIVGPCRYG